MRKQHIIAAGSITQEAEQFLRDHGAIMDVVFGVGIIALPEDALFDESYTPEYLCNLVGWGGHCLRNNALSRSRNDKDYSYEGTLM